MIRSLARGRGAVVVGVGDLRAARWRRSSGTFAVTVRLGGRDGLDRDSPALASAELDLRDVLQMVAGDLDLRVGGRLVDAAAGGDADDVRRPSGALGGVTPPPSASAARDPHRQSDATAIAAATAVRNPRPRGGVPLGLIFALSLACGVSCRARAERAALRTEWSDSPPGRLSTPPLWFPRSAAAYRSGFGRLTGRRQYSRRTRRAERGSRGRAPRPLNYHPPAAPAWTGAAFRGHVRTVGAGRSPEMKTYVATPENRQRDWYVVDAEGKTLGRLATRIADALRGKRKPEYTPHCDTGDFVVVVNAAKIRVTGNKLNDKLYHRHSGYPGGLRSRTLGEMLERRPEEVVRQGGQGDAPAEPPGAPAAHQAEGLRRSRASPRGADSRSSWRSRPDGRRRAPRRAARAAARSADGRRTAAGRGQRAEEPGPRSAEPRPRRPRSRRPRSHRGAR